MESHCSFPFKYCTVECWFTVYLKVVLGTSSISLRNKRLPFVNPLLERHDDINNSDGVQARL